MSSRVEFAGVPAAAPPWRRAWQAATSTGPGYERQPPNPRASFTAIQGYPIDYRTKTESPLARGDKLLPVTVAQVALGWWERSLAGDEQALGEFQRLCVRLSDEAMVDGNCARWWFPIPLRKYGLAAPWCSAMAQGQIASVLVRAALVTDDCAPAELARAAVRPMLGEEGSELVVSRPEGPVLEEVPSSPSSQILNGWVFALWGLWDVAVGLGDREALALFDRSMSALRARVDEYDTGWWTRYSLFPHAVQDVAKPFYHRLHVDQAELCYRLTGFSEFEAAARRWRSYDRRPNLARALAHKAIFATPRLLDR